MLWEDTDPALALPERFGLRDQPAAVGWLAQVLRENWGLRVESCDRILISATNALAWVGTDAGPFVIKVASHEPAFARLDDIAALLGRLEQDGLPVPAPVPDISGRRRAVAETDRALSVAVLPLVDGDLLDVADLAAVRDTGEVVGRLHLALADLDPTPFGAGRLDVDGELRGRLAAAPDRLPAGVAPHARAHLADLLATLPNLDIPRQLVHGDIRGANVLVREHRVAALLDFDELGGGLRTMELAMGAVMLATEFRRWPPAPVAAQEALIEGYERVLPLSDVERGWCTAMRIAGGLSQIPPGLDPAGWAAAVETGLR